MSCGRGKEFVFERLGMRIGRTYTGIDACTWGWGNRRISEDSHARYPWKLQCQGYLMLVSRNHMN
jgi:hypothetical protein